MGESGRFNSEPQYSYQPPSDGLEGLLSQIDDIQAIEMGTHDGHAIVDDHDHILRIFAVPKFMSPIDDHISQQLEYARAKHDTEVRHQSTVDKKQLSQQFFRLASLLES